MQKQKLKSLKRVSKTSNSTAVFKIKPKWFLIIFCFTSLSVSAQSVDVKILSELQEDRTQFKTHTYKFFSNSTAATSFLIPATVLTVGLIKNDKADLKKTLYIGESIAFSAITTIVLKNTIRRQRPFITNSSIIPLAKAGSYSFPSGHTSEAFAAATSLAISYPKWYVIMPAYVWAAGVAQSRMYLGVHYPSDVVGGVIVGAGSAFLMKKVNTWLQAKHTAHVNQKILN